MAILTDADYTYIKLWVRNQPTIRADFKGWTISRATWKAAIQAVEDYMVGAINQRPTTSLRTAIEAVTGTITIQRAQFVFAVWVAWRLRNFLGGG